MEEDKDTHINDKKENRKISNNSTIRGRLQRVCVCVGGGYYKREREKRARASSSSSTSTSAAAPSFDRAFEETRVVMAAIVAVVAGAEEEGKREVSGW